LTARSAQRMNIDAPHTTVPSTPREPEPDLTIDEPTTSSSAIIADPPGVLEPRSKVEQPTPAPIRFSARLTEKRGRAIDGQPSVHTIYAMDPGDANPNPANIVPDPCLDLYIVCLLVGNPGRQD
jgi:hypothetical protein